MNELEIAARFSPEDLVTSPKIIELISCAKSTQIAYCIKEFNIEKEKSLCNIFLHNSVSKVTTQLTRSPPGVQCYNPQFITDYGVGTTNSICFIRNGQVWNMPTSGGEAIQLTNLPIDVGSYRVFINEYEQIFMLIVLDVYSDKTPQETFEEDTKKPSSSAMEFDSLMVRHWDAWDIYKKRNHLFLYSLNVTQDGLLITSKSETEPLDLMKNWESDCTGKAPGQGEEDYAVSPDGFTLAFSCRGVVPVLKESFVTATSGNIEYIYRTKKDMAWTTDTNIYTLNLPKHPSEFSRFYPIPDFGCKHSEFSDENSIPKTFSNSIEKGKEQEQIEKVCFVYKLIAARCCHCTCSSTTCMCQNTSSNSRGSGNYAPSFSPSGDYIMYGCRERSQFESDKGKLKLYHIESKETQDLTQHIDISCDGVEWDTQVRDETVMSDRIGSEMDASIKHNENRNGTSNDVTSNSQLSFYVNAQYQGSYRVFRFTAKCSHFPHSHEEHFVANVIDIQMMLGDNGIVNPKLVKDYRYKHSKTYLYFLESSLLSPPELKMAIMDPLKKDEKLFGSFYSNVEVNGTSTAIADGACVTDSRSSTMLQSEEEKGLTNCIIPLTTNESRYIHTVHVTCPSFTNNDIAMPTHAEKHYFKGGNDEWVQAWYLPPVMNNNNNSIVDPHPLQDNKCVGTIPLAVIIHGGPQGAILNQWHYRWNMAIFAALGYGVIAINFHGSTGFGQEFTDSISGDWSRKPYQDIISGVKYILSHHKYLDPARVGALGASYGGYMINWLNGHNPDNLFKVFVNHDGVFNNVAMYFSTEELWFSEWEFGVPWEKEKMYRDISPSTYVNQWTTPTLVIQGGKDYRVPETEGISTFTALQRRKIHSKFLYFPDENHWVLKPMNSIKWHKTIFEWIKQYM